MVQEIGHPTLQIVDSIELCCWNGRPYGRYCHADGLIAERHVRIQVRSAPEHLYIHATSVGLFGCCHVGHHHLPQALARHQQPGVGF